MIFNFCFLQKKIEIKEKKTKTFHDEFKKNGLNDRAPKNKFGANSFCFHHKYLHLFIILNFSLF